jgi:hypothetical protein
MGKNWLIRTKSNHILGPVSKDKVVELYQNGSIKADDEICSGNGYWFFIRESDLVDKYLLGSQTQSFNPISEAKDVLTSGDPHATSGSKDDITLIGGIDLNKIKESAPKPAPQAAPKVELALATPKADQEGSQKKKVKSESAVKQSSSPKASQNYLKYFGYFVLIILILMIYFRKSIMKSFFSETASISIMSDAYAQDESPAKKKSF